MVQKYRNTYIFYQRKRKASTSIRFDAKCRAAEELNIISKIYQKEIKLLQIYHPILLKFMSTGMQSI